MIVCVVPRQVGAGALEFSKSVAKLSANTAKGLVRTALSAFDKYDVNKNRKLEISEAVELLNGPELAAAVEQLGVQPIKRTEEDIRAWFKRADFNNDGVLTKMEFTMMYVGLISERAHLGPQIVATMVVSLLDKEGDGTIDSDTLKKLLFLVPKIGFVAMLIPSGKKINYRQLLGNVKDKQ